MATAVRPDTLVALFTERGNDATAWRTASATRIAGRRPEGGPSKTERTVDDSVALRKLLERYVHPIALSVRNGRCTKCEARGKDDISKLEQVSRP